MMERTDCWWPVIVFECIVRIGESRFRRRTNIPGMTRRRRKPRRMRRRRRTRLRILSVQSNCCSRTYRWTDSLFSSLTRFSISTTKSGTALRIALAVRIYLMNCSSRSISQRRLPVFLFVARPVVRSNSASNLQRQHLPVPETAPTPPLLSINRGGAAGANTDTRSWPSCRCCCWFRHLISGNIQKLVDGRFCCPLR